MAYSTHFFLHEGKCVGSAAVVWLGASAPPISGIKTDDIYI
jgi:hypothetical protein